VQTANPVPALNPAPVPTLFFSGAFASAEPLTVLQSTAKQCVPLINLPDHHDSISDSNPQNQESHLTPAQPLASPAGTRFRETLIFRITSAPVHSFRSFQSFAHGKRQLTFKSHHVPPRRPAAFERFESGWVDATVLHRDPYLRSYRSEIFDGEPPPVNTRCVHRFNLFFSPSLHREPSLLRCTSNIEPPGLGFGLFMSCIEHRTTALRECGNAARHVRC
jgi:hypothetical protein